jgi:hypothetical protein
MRQFLHLLFAAWLLLCCLLPKGNTSELAKGYFFLQHLTEHAHGKITLPVFLSFLVDHYLAEHGNDDAHDDLPYSKVELANTLFLVPQTTLLAEAPAVLVPTLFTNTAEFYSFLAGVVLLQPPRAY